MIKRQDIAFPGGLNTDDDDKTLPQGDYRRMENLRVGGSIDEHKGMAESLLSPDQVTIDWQGTSLSAAIPLGFAPDPANNRAYVLYRDTTNGYSTIVELTEAAGTVTGLSIFEDRRGILGFNGSYPIYNARVFNNHLYWTDGNSQPMQLNISRAKKYMEEGFNAETTIVVWDASTTYGNGDLVYHGKYIYRSNAGANTGNEPPNATWWTEVCGVLETYFPDWDIRDVLFIATPPVDAPAVTYQTDSARLTNALKGNQYQFAYRWIYADYRKTVFGPASKVPRPEGEEKFSGVINEDISTNNTLQVTVDTGPTFVIGIEIIYRSSKDTSTWYRLQYLDKYNSDGELILPINGTYSVKFYDDLAPVAVAASEVYKPFHYVPQKAGFLEIIEGNNMVFAKCTEGYPQISVDVEVVKSLEDISTVVSSIDWIDDISVYIVSGNSARSLWWVRFPYQPYVGGTYYIRTYKPSEGEKIASYTLTDGTSTWVTSLRTGLQAAINAESMDDSLCSWGPCGVCGDYHFCFFPITYDPNQIAPWQYYDENGWELSAWVEPVDYMPKHLNLKEGATHGVALVYYDSERRAGPACSNEEMRFYLDYYQDDSGSGLLVNEKRWKVQLNISHLPPDWASYYQVVYTGNLSMSYYIQSRVEFIQQVTDYTELSINQWLDTVKASITNYRQGDYVFQEGDRLRIVGYYDGTDVWTEWSDFIDVEVLGIDPDDEDIFRIPRFTGDTSLNQPNGLVIEIYRPKKTYEEDIFFEISNLKFEIGTSNGYPIHKGLVSGDDQVVDVDGVTTTPCSILLTGIHDGYKYERYAGTGKNYYASSQHISDFYRPTNLTGLGFPKIEDETVKQVTLINRYRYGGSLDLNTRNNQIADFAFDGYQDLPEKHGGINGLQEVGFVLKVLQAHRVWSIYIRRTSSFNPDGTEQILLTDKIFGTTRPLSQEWGTQNPESVIVHENYMYFFDKSQGRMIRDAGNGLFDLTEYKMRSFFRSERSSILECRTGVNESFDEVWFQLSDNALSTLGSGYSMIFNEERKRWTFKLNATAHLFIKIGSAFLYADNYQVFHMDKGSTYNQFGATVLNPTVEVVGNIEPENVKIWKGIIQHSSHKLWAPQIGDIYIPSNDNYPGVAGFGMQTRLKENLVITQEGVFYGPIMNDDNTPGGASTEEKIVNGRPMRGQVIRVTLERTDDVTERIILEGLGLVYVNSKRT